MKLDADLLVRDISEEVVRRLARQAEAHGRSVEAELRALVEEAVGTLPSPPAEHRSMERWLEGMRGMDWLGDLDISELRDGPDAGRATYISPEGLDRLGDLLRRRDGGESAESGGYAGRGR